MEPLREDLSEKAVSKKARIIFLHEILSDGDEYVIALINHFHEMGHEITLFSSEYDRRIDLEECRLMNKFTFECFGNSIPRDIFGFLRGPMSFLRSLKLAMMILRSPFNERDENSTIIFLDTSKICLLLLRFMPNCKLYYIETFSHLKREDDFCGPVRYKPFIINSLLLRLADRIIVQSAFFYDLYKRSFAFTSSIKPIVVYYPINMGQWNEELVDIERVIPNLAKDSILIVCIGKFEKWSKFEFALNVFEKFLTQIKDGKLSNRFRLVLAGNCTRLPEFLYRNYLSYIISKTSFASQVSTITGLPPIYEKSLIANSEVMLFPSNCETQHNAILKAMCLRKPILAVNSSIVNHLLIRNRVGGLIAEADEIIMAQELVKLATDTWLQDFVSGAAKEMFEAYYCHQMFVSRLRYLANPK